MNILEMYPKIPKLSLLERVGTDKILCPDLQKYFDKTNITVHNQVLNTGVGVEIEIENARVALEWTAGHDQRWTIKPDHSLRNNGIEFVTIPGIRIHHTFEEIPWIIKQMKSCNYQPSDRTSVHIHINVQNLTADGLNVLLLLYVMFEEAFFRFTSPERRSNIFCTPLASAFLGYQYRSVLDLVNQTHKYTAFNISSVRSLGSVEFRHLDTVLDSTHILTWIMFLGFLKRTAAHTSLKEVVDRILKIQYESEYQLFVEWVFHGFSPLLPWMPTDIDKAASDSKLFMFGDI